MESFTSNFVMLKAELKLMSGRQNKNHILSAKLVEIYNLFILCNRFYLFPVSEGRVITNGRYGSEIEWEGPHMWETQLG